MPDKYHPFLRLLHWAMAILIVSQIALGWSMEYLEDVIGKNNPVRLSLYDLHKSFGVTILILIVVRISVRAATFIPPLPATISPIVRAGAKISHHAMYALIAATAILGYAMSDSLGKGVKLFGFPLPKVFPDNQALGETLNELHGICAYTLLVLIVLHIGAAIRHRYFDKPENDVLKRMM